MAGMLEYKCPACGAGIEWSPGAQNMECPYCGTVLTIDALQTSQEHIAQIKDEKTDWDKEGGTDWQPGETEGMRIYTCKSCGGEIVGDANMGATNCPYCNNPIVMTGQFAGDLRPDCVIPFKKTKEEAKAIYKKYLEGKKLLPRIFKDENHIDEIKGVYVPYWLFDADVEAYYHFKGTKVRTWSDRNYNYTETSYYSILRDGAMHFDKVPQDGSTRMPDDMMESLEPFDFSEAVDFRTAYLAGYMADRYDVTAEQSKERINQRVRTSTDEVMRSTMNGYVSLVPEQQNIRYASSTAHYALYPVWVLNTTWKDQKYTFAMNGQTGKFIGDLPVDKSLYWKNLLIRTAVIGGILYGASWLLYFI